MVMLLVFGGIVGAGAVLAGWRTVNGRADRSDDAGLGLSPLWPPRSPRETTEIK